MLHVFNILLLHLLLFYILNFFNFLNFLFCIGVSGEQQRDSAVHKSESILLQTP